MKLNLTHTFLELGDATSVNLAFSHRQSEGVRYGEETITESNLLEIRRRHPHLVRVYSFSKVEEARSGGDWEWHIVGRKRTLKMRVQAKRVRRNGDLRVRHMVRSSRRQQRCLLISEARADCMKPVYCIYCTEPQRTVWTLDKTLLGFETGCLLADAEHVPSITMKLDMIEAKCRPWHHLFTRDLLVERKVVAFAGDLVPVIRIRETPPSPGTEAPEPSMSERWNPPTVDDLNEDTGREYDEAGVGDTTEVDRARLQLDTDAGSEMEDGQRLQERGIRRMIVIDVQGRAESD